MKYISTVLLLLLIGCGSIFKHKQDFKNIGHEIVDEEVDDLIDEEKKV
jgi:hypothetical protein